MSNLDISDKIWKELNEIENNLSNIYSKKVRLERSTEVIVAHLLRKIFELEEKLEQCQHQ